MGRGALKFYHLLFTDYATLFRDATTENLECIWFFLLYIEAISGLKLNFGNNKLVPALEIEEVEGLASFLCNKEGSLPMS